MNAAERAAMTPQFVPELIVQRDTLVLYISTGLNPGNWQTVSDSAAGAAAFASLTGLPTDNANLAAALLAKQDALGFTPEDVANKDVDSAMTANSDTKYPSQKAVKTALATKPTAALDTDSTFAANSDARVPSQKAVKTALNALLAANDAMVYKGLIDCSSNPNYPAADAGATYRVSVVGKIGGASGISVEVGDMLICLFDGTPSGNQATVGADWGIIETNIDGEVIGPVSSTDGHIPQFDGPSGKLLKDGIDPSSLEVLSNRVANLDAPDNLTYPTSAAVATPLTAAATTALWGGITGGLEAQADLVAALLGKQDALGFSPESLSNRVVTLVGADDDHYPTAGAVADGLSDKEDALGFTPEDVTNKATDLTSNDDTHYPTTQAVATALAAGASSGNYTPTPSSTANLNLDPTTFEARWTRIGNIVTVSGKFIANPTVPATGTNFIIDIPIATSASDDQGDGVAGLIDGAGTSNVGFGFKLRGGSIQFVWSSVNNTENWAYTFSYQVV